MPGYKQLKLHVNDIHSVHERRQNDIGMRIQICHQINFIHDRVYVLEKILFTLGIVTSRIKITELGMQTKPTRYSCIQ
jgi:hypothetical protein